MLIFGGRRASTQNLIVLRDLTMVRAQCARSRLSRVPVGAGHAYPGDLP